jgi:hypothetical protein
MSKICIESGEISDSFSKLFFFLYFFRVFLNERKKERDAKESFSVSVGRSKRGDYRKKVSSDKLTDVQRKVIVSKQLSNGL